MPDEFKYDVFLSHSAKDKATVRPVAERLKKDGLRVWLDEWEIKPGDNIPAKIEEGLERSRVLVLCMSADAFGSDWAQLESGTFRFRDPLNKERRFIPLRLDDAPIKGSLAQFSYIDWRSSDREQEYAKLLGACRPNNVVATTPVEHTSVMAVGKVNEAHSVAEVLDEASVSTILPATGTCSIAVDSTLLLSADSFIEPETQRFKDPGAREDFKWAATFYCNNCSLFFPVPKTRVPSPTPLLGLWYKDAVERPMSALNDKGRADVVDELTPVFRRFAGDVWNAHRLLNWLLFQFRDDELARFFWAGGNIPEELLALRRYVEELRVSLDPDSLYRLIAKSKLRTPPAHADAVRKCDGGNLALFALCYLFHAFVKGRFYAMCLPKSPEGPTYWWHWLREDAVKKAHRGKGNAVLLLNWGTILENVFHPDHPLVDRQPESVVQVFHDIRDYSVRNGQGILRDDAKPRELEEVALDGLRAAKIVPKRRNKENPFWELLHNLIEKKKGESLYIYAESQVISYVVKSEWIKKWSNNRRGRHFDRCRRADRERLWDHYEDPGIQNAIKNPVSIRLASSELSQNRRTSD